MAHTYTENDLLLYYYGELPTEQTAVIRHLIETDPEWQQRYSDVQLGLEMLDSLSEEPSPTSVEHILQHSLEEKKKHEMV